MPFTVNITGFVPPLALNVMLPLLPLHNGLVTLALKIIDGTGAMVRILVTEQRFKSVTVTVYVPAVTLGKVLPA